MASRRSLTFSPPLRPYDQRVDGALRKKDPDDFLETLAFLDERWNGVPFEHTPHPLGMFGGLWILHQDVTTEGIWKYLDQAEGSQFNHALRWCRKIGATRAVEYLRRVAALFEAGVPVDQSERFELRNGIEQVAYATGTTDPLNRLDSEYADAMPAMVNALRRWLIANRGAALRALNAIGAPPREIRDDGFIKRAETFALSFASLLTSVSPSVRRENELRLEKATKARLIPWGTRLRPECNQFLEVTETFTKAQWQIVARGAAADESAHVDALYQAAAFRSAVEEMRGVDRIAVRQTFQRYYARRAPALDSIATLPGRSAPASMKSRAERALLLATLVLPLHEWFEHVAPNGKRILETAYAPFTGMAPTPTPFKPRKRPKS